jgi:hypothetical protein
MKTLRNSIIHGGNKRNFVRSLLASMAVLACSSTVMALPIDVNFQDMADGSWGESAWKPLSLSADFGLDVDIYGTYNGNNVYAYLDYGKAGLGTCRDLNTTDPAKINTKKSGSGSNLCSPSSDDNVNVYDGLGEGLKFLFNQNITVKDIWFNNNHDRDYGMEGDTVTVGGVNHTFVGARNDADLGWRYSFGGDGLTFAPTQMLTIDYFVPGDGSELRGEEFYISAVLFDLPPQLSTLRVPSAVPLPSTLALFGLGIAGLGWSRCKKA